MNTSYQIKASKNYSEEFKVITIHMHVERDRVLVLSCPAQSSEVTS